MDESRLRFLESKGKDIVHRMLPDIVRQHPAWLEPIYIAMEDTCGHDIQILRDKAPESWAERLDLASINLDRMLENDISLRALKIILLRNPSLKPSPKQVVKILERPSTILRDKVYYMALRDRSERVVLRHALQSGPNQAVFRRLHNIEALFYKPIPKHKYIYANPSTVLTEDIYQVHPIYIIPVKSGDIIYGLHVAEIIASIEGDISRPFINPWTRGILTDNARDAVLMRWNLLIEEGYPLIPISKDDYGILIPDEAQRLVNAISNNDWEVYDTVISIVNGLNPRLLMAAKNTRRFIPYISAYIDDPTHFPSIWRLFFSMFPNMASYAYAHRLTE